LLLGITNMSTSRRLVEAIFVKPLNKFCNASDGCAHCEGGPISVKDLEAFKKHLRSLMIITAALQLRCSQTLTKNATFK
jgi:hypothetical protein